MEKVEKMIKVMQAYNDGKEIEFLSEETEGNWAPCKYPIWDWSHNVYRVKSSKTWLDEQLETITDEDCRKNVDIPVLGMAVNLARKVLEMYEGNSDTYNGLKECFKQLGIDVEAWKKYDIDMVRPTPKTYNEMYNKPSLGDLRNNGTEVYVDGKWQKVKDTTQCAYAYRYDENSKYCKCSINNDKLCKATKFELDNCNIITKVTQPNPMRRMTNYELAKWLSEGPKVGEFREYKDSIESVMYVIDSRISYTEAYQDVEVSPSTKVRINKGEWFDPLIEV